MNERPIWLQPMFWVAMVFAVAVKLRASPRVTLRTAIGSAGVAVAGAVVFTDAAVGWLALPDEHARYAVAALVALTCEHVARLLLEGRIGELLTLWRDRGGGGAP